MSETKEIKAVEKKCAPVIEDAKALKIEDETGLEVAKDMVRNLRSLMKEVKETFDPIVTKANEVHKEATGQRKKHLAPLESAKLEVESTIGKYADHLREQARIAEEKRIDDRNKEIEKITRRMSKHLDGYKDIEDQIAELEKKIEKGGLTEVEDEVINKQLSALESKRNAKAETVERNQTAIEEAETMPATSPSPAASLKGAGGSRTERIPTLYNKEALIKAIAEGKAPIDLLDENMGKIKKYVNAFPNSRVQGVSIETKSVVRVR